VGDHDADPDRGRAGVVQGVRRVLPPAERAAYDVPFRDVLRRALAWA
jgi:hypothetical protein